MFPASARLQLVISGSWCINTLAPLRPGYMLSRFGEFLRGEMGLLLYSFYRRFIIFCVSRPQSFLMFPSEMDDLHPNASSQFALEGSEWRHQYCLAIVKMFSQQTVDYFTAMR